MRKIVDRMPPKLQSSWRDNAGRILDIEKREVGIEDISKFVEEKSRALSNPVFGKLRCVGKDKRDVKRRRAKPKPKVLGPKELNNFSTSSEKNPANQIEPQEKSLRHVL